MLNVLKNVCLLKTLYYNSKLLRIVKPKFLIGRNSIILLNKTSKIIIEEKLSFGILFCNKQKTLLNVGANATLDIKNLIVGNGCRISVGENATFKVGKNVFINENTRIMVSKKIEIGDNSILGWNVNILDNDRHNVFYDDIQQETTKEIIIKNNVWVGFNSSILKGVTIGEGAIIASNSVVTKDVPPYTLMAGVPAKIIKKNVKWKR